MNILGGNINKMIKVKVFLYFNSDVEKAQNCTIFDMEASSVEEVTNMMLSQNKRQPINIEGGYRVINFDNVCYIDIIAVEDNNCKDEER